MSKDDLSHDAEYVTARTVEAFRENLQRVRSRMASAAHSVGRDPDGIRLLPVSKTVPAERTRLGVAAGITELGENRVQEAYEKWEVLSDLDVRWSVIGNLQTNKAKYVARFADEFQALDRLRVAETLERRLEKEDRTMDVFVQVNTSNEDSKYGVPPAELAELLQQLRQFERLNVRGLMTLAVFSNDPARVRPCFQLLHTLREQMRNESGNDGLSELSMGMSGDYELAIAEGATVVRVGQAIFGSRVVPDSYYWPS